MICIEVTLSGTADSVYNLIESSLPDYLQGLSDIRMDCIIQNPVGNDDLYLGDVTTQKGFIVNGNSMDINQLNLLTTYIDGTSSESIIILLKD